jgi:hypothetical protein
MAPNTTAKEQARRLYFQSNFTQQQIADIAGVNVRTVFDWINQGDWKRAKDMVLNAPTFLAEQYYHQLAALNKTIAARLDAPYPTKEESEIMRRVTATLKTVKGKRSRPELVEILADFSAFAADYTPALGNVLPKVISAFLDALSGNGPAARLAQIKEPVCAAAGYEDHAKEMLAFDEQLTAEEQNADNPPPEEQQAQLRTQRAELQVAAVNTRTNEDRPHIVPLYGVDWLDHMAAHGLPPVNLVKKLSYKIVPDWMKPFYYSDDPDPFDLVAALKQEQIGIRYFYDNIKKNQPKQLEDAFHIYGNNSPGVPGDPVTNAQTTVYQQQGDPVS